MPVTAGFEERIKEFEHSCQFLSQIVALRQIQAITWSPSTGEGKEAVL